MLCQNIPLTCLWITPPKTYLIDMTKFIPFEGAQIAYSVSGQGLPLVFLHGFCEDASLWTDFVTHFPDNKYRTILIDLPGFGNSDVIPNVSITKMAQAVRAVLEEIQAIPAVLFGHSMGGYTALAYGELFPEGLTGLGMIHSHPFADSEERRQHRIKSVEFIRNQGHSIFVKQLVPTFFAPTFAKDNRFLVESMTLKAANYDKEGIIQAQLAMAARPDRSTVLQKLDCPVLFVVGEEDQLIPLELSVRQTLLPDEADVHILNKTGHLSMMECTYAAQKIFLQFIEWCSSKTQ